ncbi:calcium homeostasis modulator protein 6-like [Styela clava]|uniref:calcium homeostasis modulator protein 6-like n=1 Tax=Styela clava TaxID=7725 RepID=UPI0019397C5E|nr:calcium homeostasis modulator protein 6-like [Styela clava]
MAQLFAAFGKFGANNKGSIQNFGIVGITIGSEELMKFIFFFCPCSRPMNEIYGATFIWGPAAILLVVGYVVNRRTWRLTTGMCNRTQGVGKGCKRVFHFMFIFLNITMKAILAPATWIVISFLKGDYYACAAWPRPDDPGVEEKFSLAPNTTIPPPCYFKAKPVPFDRSVSESIARDLRAYSHIVGWWFLTWALMLGVFFMFVFRCLSKYSYEQGKYIDKYRANEMSLFEEGLDTKAKAQAKIVVDQFFSKPRSKEEWDQIASINDKVMRSKRGRPIYSPMHKFVNKELVALELAQDDIVTDSAKKKHHLSSLIKKKKPATTAGSKWPTPGKLSAGTTAPPLSATNKPPATVQTSRGPAPAAIPMVAMATGRNRTVIQQPRKPVEMHEGTHASVVEQQQPNQDVDNAPPVPARDDQNLAEGIENDPIMEANVQDRSSLLPPVANLEEDPIKEANIVEQADFARQSMENLNAHDDVEMNGDNDFQAEGSDENDSQPLLT